MMHYDAFVLLINSYAQQATAIDPATSVRVEPGVDEEQGYPFAAIYITPGPLEPEAHRGKAVAERLARLLKADDQITLIDERDPTEGYALDVEGITKAEWDALLDDGDDNALLPPDGPASALDDALYYAELPEGPLEVPLPGHPPLDPTKPTRMIAVGLQHVSNTWTGQIYAHATLPDPDRAQYWALKHERAHKEKGFPASTSAVWQHDASNEDLLAQILKQLNRRDQPTIE